MGRELRSKIAKVVSKISQGIITRMIDLVLFWIYYSQEMSPFSGGSLYQRFSRIEKDFSQLNSQILKRAIKKAQVKGWLNKELGVTKKGQKRLNSILPKYEKREKWNGRWYIVAYDVPENKKWLRDILRDKLKELGFGQLHKSLWISPYNFLGDVEKIIAQYNLSSFVLLAISNKLGREPSDDLAERIWKLQDIDDDYKKYIHEVKSKKLSRKEAIFKYLTILEKDPQFPPDLLPADWKGDQAHKIYQKLRFTEKISFKK